MKNTAFQVGDRIVLTSYGIEDVYGFPVGIGGVVYQIGAWGNDYGVVFDIAASGGHDLGMEDVPYGRGLWVNDEQITLEASQMDDISPDELMEMLI